MNTNLRSIAVMHFANVYYIPTGTIAYVKTIDNEIRMCKCLKTKWVDIYNIGVGFPVIEWKVAGFEKTFNSIVRDGTYYLDKISIGTIYKDEYYAQISSATNYNHDGQVPRVKINLEEYLKSKYGFEDNCVQVTCNGLRIFIYAINNDNTIKSGYCNNFELSVTQDGFNMTIPAIENGTAFPTQKDAEEHIKPLKVYTFDDEENINKPTPTKVKLTIEIDINHVDDIKGFATII